MRIVNIAAKVALLLLGALLLSFHLAAQTGPPVERVLLKAGQLLIVQGGAALPMTADVTLPDDIKVRTNATYRVQGGKERKLLDGQSLGADGMLTSPDGSIVPVVDHVIMKNGRVLICIDGVSAPVQSDTPLRNGTVVTPDGYYVAHGWRTKLLDGQLFKLSGAAIPVKDSVTLSGGKVRVQKDGSQFDVPPRSSIMMNEGTKVFGDGTVLMRDGTTKKLAEGEILTLEGVVRK